MGEQCGLGLAGRSRGVDGVGEIGRVRPPNAAFLALGGEGLGVPVEIDYLAAAGKGGRDARRLSSVMSTLAPQSSSMKASRSAGYSGSSGT